MGKATPAPIKITDEQFEELVERFNIPDTDQVEGVCEREILRHLKEDVEGYYVEITDFSRLQEKLEAHEAAAEIFFATHEGQARLLKLQCAFLEFQMDDANRFIKDIRNLSFWGRLRWMLTGKIRISEGK